jgi:prepilin-type N-terminal cleavage/methylation domain-containing protein/prepilin-type processing-associated H-X9-DG protein
MVIRAVIPICDTRGRYLTMLVPRRRGFTLIELLVVIAIIGILAAMLFPVFARARESARKVQCLANVKNIALAVQMYLVDYDKFWPSGHTDPNMVDLVMDMCGCVRDCRVTTWHPYLRVPVILDEYIKNRDVWKCPSSRLELGAGHGFPINPCIPNWYTAARRDGCRALGCETFPPGWGGDVTDSNVQGRCSGDGGGVGAFRMSISNPCILRNLSTSALRDPSRMVVAGDAGYDIDQAMYTQSYAYPDYRLPQGMLQEDCGGHSARGHCDDASCGDYATADACTPLSPCFGGDARIITDVSYRKQHARHLGGANLGFADGHAKWMDSEVVLRGGADHSRWGIHPQVFYGMCVCINLDNKPRDTRPAVDDPTWGHY